MSRASFKTYGILSKNLHGAVSCFHLAVTNLGIYLRLANKGFMVLDKASNLATYENAS